MLLGYQLIDARTLDVIQQWSESGGRVPNVPAVIRLPNGDDVCFPDLNTEYSGYVLVPWEVEDPEPTPTEPSPPPVPTAVPMWAVRTILQNDGLFDTAQALVEASTDNALKNVWEYGNDALRSSPAINALGAALGLTQAQIDQMFRDAGGMTV